MGDSADFFYWIGVATFLITIWRLLLTFYRRVILPSKKPLQYGKWAIVTGCTNLRGFILFEKLYHLLQDLRLELGRSLPIIWRSRVCRF